MDVGKKRLCEIVISLVIVADICILSLYLLLTILLYCIIAGMEYSHSLFALLGMLTVLLITVPTSIILVRLWLAYLRDQH